MKSKTYVVLKTAKILASSAATVEAGGGAKRPLHDANADADASGAKVAKVGSLGGSLHFAVNNRPVKSIVCSILNQPGIAFSHPLLLE